MDDSDYEYSGFVRLDIHIIEKHIHIIEKDIYIYIYIFWMCGVELILCPVFRCRSTIIQKIDTRPAPKKRGIYRHQYEFNIMTGFNGFNDGWQWQWF